jgi:hypothetical protein
MPSKPVAGHCAIVGSINRRIIVQVSLRGKKERPYLKNNQSKKMQVLIKENERRQIQEMFMSGAPLAHTYNPSYMAGRDQEDCGSKIAQAKNCETLSQKYPTQAGTSDSCL